MGWLGAARPRRLVLLVLDEAVIVVVVRRQGGRRVEAGSAVLQGQAHLDQLGLDLVDRLRTEVADVEQVLLRARDQLTRGVDALALEAVVGANRQVQVLDREGEVLRQLLVDGRGTDVDALGLDVELARQAEQLHQRLTCRGDGITRGDRRLGLDVDDQLVEVGALLDSGGLDLVGHLEHGAVDRVDGQPADLVVRALVLHRGDVATTALDDELHLDLALVVQGGDLQVGVVHLDTGGDLDVGSGHDAGAGLAQHHGHRLVVLAGDHEALEVEDDLGDVFLDALDGGELVQGTLHLDAGHGGPRDRGQQGATQRVAERVAEAGFQRFVHEPRAELVDDLFRQGRALSDEHSCFPFRAHPLFDGLELTHGWGLWCLLLGVVLDDELFLDRQLDLRPQRPRVHEHPHARRNGLEPRRDDPLAVGLPGDDERRHLQALLAHVDDVVGVDLVGRDVDLLAVDAEVAVRHQLTGVAARPGEPGAVDHVVQTALEQLQQVVTGLAGTTAGLVVVVVELLLHHAVGEAGLLLLLQLVAVLALLDPRAAVLAGRVGALLEGLVLADEVDTETARLLGHGAGVTSHGSSVSCSVSGSDAPALGRAATVVRGGRDVLDRADLEADGTQRTDRGLTARSRTLDEDVDLLHAVVHRTTTGGLGGHLGGERRGLARALEADGAGRGPRDHRAGGVGDRDDGVVERALDVGLALGDVLLLLAAHLLGAGRAAALGGH